MLRKPIKISKNITVGPQVDATELEALAGKGFKTIVNLCKKGEFEQKLSPEEEAEQAKAVGLNYVHLPVSVSNWKHDHFDTMMDELSGCEKPIYLHCLMGQRSAPFGLLFYAIKKNLAPEQLMSKAEKLGFDWNAPVLRTFIESYLHRRMKEAA